MNRLQEILDRKAEIRTMLEGDQDVNMKEIQEELRNLQEEEKKIIEKRQLAENIQINKTKIHTIKKPKNKVGKKVEVRNIK